MGIESAITLGMDEGDPITSCTVDILSSSAKKRPRRPNPETQPGKALNELEHLILDGKFTVSGEHERIRKGTKLVKISDWEAACRKKRLSTGKEESEIRAFQRAKRELAKHFVGTYGEYVWLIEHLSR